jgi:methionyl-tRNA formyltransferase
VRAYTPWPGAYTYWHGKLLKILSAHAPSPTLEPEQQVAPGTVSVRKEAGHEVLAIVTGAGILLVNRLQLEGKKVLSAEEFLRGYPQIVGEVLGS